MRLLLGRKAIGTNILALVLVFSLVLIFSVSLGYILIHAEHHCIGEHCPICERIAVCANTLLRICDGWLPLILLSVLGENIVRHKSILKAFVIPETTPVLRHIRMNR